MDSNIRESWKIRFHSQDRSQLIQECGGWIETDPDLITAKYYLGLAYLLIRDEEQAQLTWIQAMSCINDDDNQIDLDGKLSSLIEILEEQADFEDSVGEVETSWLIRRHLHYIDPRNFLNILKIIDQAMLLEIFQPRQLEELNFFDLLKGKEVTNQESILLSKVIQNIVQHCESKSTPAVGKPKPALVLDSIIKMFTPPYKLHIGCGSVNLSGWINIDEDMTSPAVNLPLDINHGLPFKDDSCIYIYNEHFLEHLSVDSGFQFLKECYRILKKDGVLRIAMPCLDYLISKSTPNNWRDQDWLTWPGFEFIQTRAEMMNIAFRWWGHQWLYDYEELHRRLCEAGFANIQLVAWGQSVEPELCGLETRKDSNLICEARKFIH